MTNKYKQTEIGLIPEDWEVVRLGNISFFQNGLAHESIENVFGEFVVINSKFISTGGRIYRQVSHRLAPLWKNDIVIVMSDIPNGKALAKCYLVECDNHYTLNQRIGRIIATENSKFLFYILNRNSYYLAFDSGSGQTNLRKQEVLDCPIPLPPLPEQRAIAQTLSDTDAWIESMEGLIAKKRLMKQGAMQQLLTPKPDWEVKKLGEILASYQLGGNYSTTNVPNDAPLIKMGNLGRGRVNLNKIEYITKNNVLNERDVLRRNDVLFNTRNTLDLVGKVSLWNNELRIAYYNSNILRLDFDSSIISSHPFVVYSFNTKSSLDKLKEVAIGTTSVAAIYTRYLLNFTLSYPSLSEQTRIATILSDMDGEIEALEQKLGKARQLKQGMMQVLLTGKVRLV